MAQSFLSPQLKRYNIEYSFNMLCHTRNYTIKAVSLSDAQELAQQAIVNGQLDTGLFEVLSGDLSKASWSICNGSDHGYELSDVSMCDD